jgi:hypothetical protein
MPRRKGLFGRIREWFRGAPEPSRQPPPRRESVPLMSEPLRPLPAHDAHEDRMREIFNDVAGGYNYHEWREVYDPMSVVFQYHDTEDEDNEDIEDYWDMFLRSYYLTSSEPGSVPREQFHNDTNIPPAEVDWDLWRAIKRGTT